MRLLASALVIAALSVYPQPQEKATEVDVSGYYAVDGKEPSGKVYSGVVLIQQVGDIYVIQWTTGGTQATGIGQRHGNKLSVGWKVEGGGPLGCTVYTISKDGKELSGSYVMLTGKGITPAHPETLSLLRRLPKPIKGDI